MNLHQVENHQRVGPIDSAVHEIRPHSACSRRLAGFSSASYGRLTDEGEADPRCRRLSLYGPCGESPGGAEFFTVKLGTVRQQHRVGARQRLRPTEHEGRRLAVGDRGARDLRAADAPLWRKDGLMVE
jgi:hypothetical protein